VTTPSNAVREPLLSLHPGTVHFVGPDGSERDVAADTLPATIAFAQVGDLWEPVVRVEAIAVNGRVVSIARYAADGRVLERITPAPPPR